YSATLAASGGTPPYSWGLAAGSGALPAGLTLSTGGAITGTPTSTGSSTFTVQVSDNAANTATAQLSITVNSQSGGQFASQFVSQSVPTFLSPGDTFSASMTWRNTGTAVWNQGPGVDLGAQNPQNNINWGSDRISFQSYEIPPSTQFTITIGNFVAPSIPGVYNFQWQMVQDNGAGFFGDLSPNVSITVANPSSALTIQTAAISAAQVGTAFNQQLSAAGGTPPYTWSVLGSGLPAGLSLNPATGTISGTPSQPGTFALALKVTDSASQISQKALGMTIAPSRLTINAPAFPTATVGSSFSQQLSASGGIGPYDWAVTSGALPGGLTLNSSSGLMSGSPSTPGAFSFTVTVTDRQPMSASTALQITVVGSGPTPQVSVVKYKPAPEKLIIRGQNFDLSAVVLIDGATDGSQLPIKSRDAGDIVIRPVSLSSGQHQLQVVNPNGLRSGVFRFTVP
ncbi:MAG TPA: putative Ig domain-containing protein, partial [Blastocatellia bacterium]|nr:putative Ig domain-containing protein [Blastocatellia bacterium]